MDQLGEEQWGRASRQRGRARANVLMQREDRAGRGEGGEVASGHKGPHNH